MTDIESVKRVKVQITVAGQVAEIDRALVAPDHWTNVSDAEVISFARELTDLVLAGLGYGHDDEAAEGLRVRPNPEPPTDDALFELFRLAHGDEPVNVGPPLGLRAVWRHGCDAGMVAPLSSPARSEGDPK